LIIGDYFARRGTHGDHRRTLRTIQKILPWAFLDTVLSIPT
jgi:hypothetical protein